MSHGTEPNIATQKQAEERNGSMSSATRSQEVPRIQTSSSVHEISKESIQVRQGEIRRNSTIDSELSDHLEQYRETLHRSSESSITATKATTENSVEKTPDTTKSTSRGNKKRLKGTRDSLQEVSFLEDPLGFLANLLTKLERALLRSLQGDKAIPLPAPNPQQSMAIPQLKRRKKKKGSLSHKGGQRGTQLTTLYHLEHLNEELRALNTVGEEVKDEATPQKKN
jgi:hypothetical protein